MSDSKGRLLAEIQRLRAEAVDMARVVLALNAELRECRQSEDLWASSSVPAPTWVWKWL
jgi:hypothetical protein